MEQPPSVVTQSGVVVAPSDGKLGKLVRVAGSEYSGSHRCKYSEDARGHL